jgi:hypothetical protein
VDVNEGIISDDLVLHVTSVARSHRPMVMHARLWCQGLLAVSSGSLESVLG